MRSVFQSGKSKRHFCTPLTRGPAEGDFRLRRSFETVAFFFPPIVAKRKKKKKGESRNCRRLESVWYKHALICVINRFNFEEDTGLRRKHAILEVQKLSAVSHFPPVFQRKLDSQSSKSNRSRQVVLDGSLHRPDAPEVTTVSIWLCSPVWAILLPFVFVGQGHPRTKETAWNGQWTIRWGEGGTLGNKIRGQVRVHRVWSLRGKNTTSFPGKFCALDSMFGALCAAAYASEVQQGARGFLQLLVQLRLDLSPWPLIDGPLNGRRMSRSLLEASLFPEVRVLVAVEALAASTAGLPAVEASFVQGGQGWGGGAGGAALQCHAAVVVVLLRIAAHQDWIGPREVQWTVRIAWGRREARAKINKHTKWGFTGCKWALMTHEISYLQ